MHSRNHPAHEKVRVRFERQVLDAASVKAAQQGETLSDYVQRLVELDLSLRGEC